MNFRKLGTILPGLSAALMLSCSDSDTGDGPAAGDGLTVSPLTIEAVATAETYDIEIKTKAPWEAQANKDFIKVSPSWGIGNATMVITVEKNRTQEERSAVVVVWIDEENAREITITQAAGTEAPAGERKFYVTENGSTDNSGLHWDEPTTLEWALGEAVAGEEIHIAAGTYTPTKFLTGTETSGDDNNKTFEIDKNITLIGGYPGAPEEGATADPAINKTILSGKLSETANAYHVMVISAPLAEGESVKVKGLYIQDGVAVAKLGPTVNGEACQTRNGGGLVVQGATRAELEDCVIANNTAETHDGGGVYLKKATEVRFTRCRIRDNKTNDAGAPAAGICNDCSVVYLYDCTFENNQAGGNSAAIQAAGGGGITAETYAFNCTFNKNSSGVLGDNRDAAGYYSLWTAKAAFVNCTFYENKVIGGQRGGALNVNSGDLDVISCTIHKNDGKSTGGGVQIRTADAKVRIYNSVIAGNIATTAGMEDIGYDNESAARAVIRNSVVGTAVYDAGGSIAEGAQFDAATMFGSFGDNGGHTSTIALTGSDNPAVTGGMSASELSALAKDTLVPAADAGLVTKDQTGADRSGRQMGACVR